MLAQLSENLWIWPSWSKRTSFTIFENLYDLSSASMSPSSLKTSCERVSHLYLHFLDKMLVLTASPMGRRTRRPSKTLSGISMILSRLEIGLRFGCGFSSICFWNPKPTWISSGTTNLIVLWNPINICFTRTKDVSGWEGEIKINKAPFVFETRTHFDYFRHKQFTVKFQSMSNKVS